MSGPTRNRNRLPKLLFNGYPEKENRNQNTEPAPRASRGWRFVIAYPRFKLDYLEIFPHFDYCMYQLQRYWRGAVYYLGYVYFKSTVSISDVKDMFQDNSIIHPTNYSEEVARKDLQTWTESCAHIDGPWHVFPNYTLHFPVERDLRRKIAIQNAVRKKFPLDTDEYCSTTEEDISEEDIEGTSSEDDEPMEDDTTMQDLVHSEGTSKRVIAPRLDREARTFAVGDTEFTDSDLESLEEEREFL